MIALYIGEVSDDTFIFNPAYQTDTEDALLARFSLFRGPNYVVWYNYQASETTLSALDTSAIYILRIMDRGTLIDDVKLKLESCIWNGRLECWEYMFVPLSLYFCRKDIDIYVEGKITLYGVFEKILSYSPDKIGLVATDNLKSTEFNSFHRHGVMADMIADLCMEYGYEFAFISDKLYIGNVIEGDSNMTYTVEDNTIATYKSEFGKVISGRLIGDNGPMGGSIIRVGNINSKPEPTRVIFAEFRYTDLEMKYNFVGIDSPINEFGLLHLIPFDLRSDLEAKLMLQKRSIQMATIKSADKFEEKVTFGSTSHDAGNLILNPQKYNARVVIGSPYAGETVGMQFPANPKATAVVANDIGNEETAVQIAQVFQDKKAPGRSSEDDFRLTLPDGGTLYYEKSSGTWILAAKSKVEIGTLQNSIDQKPQIESSAKAAARAEDPVFSDNTVDAKYWAFIKALYSVVSQVSTYPEPGNGAPLIFHQALMAAFKGVGEPTKLDSKVKEGSSNVIIG